MKLLRLLLLLAVAFSGGSVLAAQPATAETAAPTDASASTTVTGATTAVESRIVGLLDDKHKLAPGDKVSFRITEDRDPTVGLIVADSGELDVPYLGRVKCTGKTCKQLGLELKGLLEQDFYYHANVVVGLDAVNKVRGKVYIWGQVRTQGPIEIPAEENFTVGKAIGRAGGFGDFANKRNVKLIRTLPDGTKKEEILNMEEILEKGKTEKDKILQEDDFIIVPERLFNF